MTRTPRCSRPTGVIQTFRRGLGLGLRLTLVMAMALASAVLPSSLAWAISGTIGANLEVLSADFGGGGGGGGGATFTFITDPLNPGFTITGNTPITDTSGQSGSSQIAFSLEALNGFLIHDVSASIVGSFTGTGTGSVTIPTPGGPLVLGHPTTGGPTTLSGELTFAPVNTLAEVITFAGAGGSDGSVTLSSLTYQVSLVGPAAVPEPSTLLLLGSGLSGLGGLAWRRRPPAKRGVLRPGARFSRLSRRCLCAPVATAPGVVRVWQRRSR